MNRTILYVNTPSFTGGAEISLLTLMRHLDSARYRPVLVTGGEGRLTMAAREFGIETHVQDFPWFRKRYPWRYPASILRLSHTIRECRAVVVHSNCDHSLRYVMQACHLNGSPYVSHVRDFVRAWFQPPNLKALNGASAVIVSSQALASACLDAGVRRSIIEVIYNPVDISLYRMGNVGDTELRCNLGLTDDAFLVGIMGQIQPIKGHGELVDAAANVIAAIPRVHFVVVGDTFTDEQEIYKAQLMKSIADLGLSERFSFLGFRTDIPNILHSLDVLVVPSWTEPFGRVVVEGLAAGCPVIGTNAGGIPEIIQDGVSGLLIPPHDPESLAAAIVTLAQDEVLRRQIRQGGLHSAQRFNISHHVNQVQNLYDSILGASARVANT